MWTSGDRSVSGNVTETDATEESQNVTRVGYGSLTIWTSACCYGSSLLLVLCTVLDLLVSAVHYFHLDLVTYEFLRVSQILRTMSYHRYHDTG